MAAIVLGFVIPVDVSTLTPAMVPMLAVLVFVSSFRVTVHDVRDAGVFPAGVFYVVRHVALPVCLWAIVAPWQPVLAVGILLVALAPAGVASLGVSTFFGGNTGLSIVIVVVSSVLAPFIIPVVLRVVLARTIPLDFVAMFRTLVFTVLVPLILHLPVRRMKKTALWFSENGALFLTPIVSLLVVVGIGQQRGAIAVDPARTLFFILAGFVVFLTNYLVGWFLPLSKHAANRISYSIASGVNNLSITLVLALLYFPPAVLLFVVACEFAWVFGIVVFKRVVNRRRTAS